MSGRSPVNIALFKGIPIKTEKVVDGSVDSVVAHEEELKRFGLLRRDFQFESVNASGVLPQSPAWRDGAAWPRSR